MEPEPRPPLAPVSRRRSPVRDPGPRFSPGDALSSSFAIFGKQLPMLLLLAAAFHALPLWLEILNTRAVVEVAKEAEEAQTNASWFRAVGGPIFFAALIAQWVLPLAFQAVVTFAVFQTLRGGGARWGESLGLGVRRLPHALGASVVVVLAIGVPVFVVAMFAGIVSFVLGAVLYCMWYVAVQVAVVEGVNPFTAISRSAFLTNGARGGIFAVVCVTYGLPTLLLLAIQHLVLPPVPDDVVDMPRILVETGFGVVFGCLQAVAAVVVYHALRKAKEGVGLDELLAVFD